jgi:hypothetical protein
MGATLMHIGTTSRCISDRVYASGIWALLMHQRSTMHLLVPDEVQQRSLMHCRRLDADASSTVAECIAARFLCIVA